MKRSSKLRFVAAGVVLAWTAVAAPPIAAAERDVRVINTAAEPVPVAVQGTATVTGGVQVTNDAANPVPTVALGTTQVSGNVNVQNSSVNPLHVVAPAPAAEEFFARNGLLTLANGETVATAEFDVPPGKRLIVRTVSAYSQAAAFTYDGIDLAHFFGGNPHSESSPDIYLPLHQNSPGSRTWSGTAAVTFAEDDKMTIRARRVADDPLGNVSLYWAVMGTLVDAPSPTR